MPLFFTLLDLVLPKANGFPPDTPNAKPNCKIDDTDHKTKTPPSANINIARSKKYGGCTGAVVGHT